MDSLKFNFVRRAFIVPVLLSAVVIAIIWFAAPKIIESSNAVSDCFSFFVNICIALGIAFAVVGVVILAANLAYYTKKERRIKAVHEENSQLRSEYMEQINNKPKNNSSNGSDKEKLTLSNK